MFCTPVHSEQKTFGDHDVETDLTVGNDATVTGITTTDSLTTVEFEVEADGDTFWVGSGTGVPYGECYGDEIAWTQVAVQDTWYDISDADMSSDELNLVTHDGSGKLTLTKAGVYQVGYSMVLQSSAANSHMQLALTINDSATPHVSTVTHYETKFANQETSVFHMAILTVTAGQTINAMILSEDAGTPTLTIHDLHIIVTMIGG